MHANFTNSRKNIQKNYNIFTPRIHNVVGTISINPKIWLSLYFMGCVKLAWYFSKMYSRYFFFPSEDTGACSVVTTILSTDSTNPDCFTVPMAVLVEMCYGNNKATTQLPGPSNTLAAGPTVPCPMSLLDSLTVHAKMRYYLFQASSSPIPRM